MKKVLLCTMALIAMNSVANATTISKPINDISFEVDYSCKWSFTVVDAKGNLLDGGIYASHATGSDCLLSFGNFVKSLEALYPGATISYTQL